MNVSDPLWRSKHNISASTDSSMPTQVNMLKTFYDSVGQSGFEKIALLADLSPIDTLDLSQNQTDALITAISTAGPHLFTFQTFLIVAFTLTIMTIILPLVAGNIFRFLLQSVDHYKGHWRVLVFIFSIATIVLTRVFIPYRGLWIYIVIFGVPQAMFACFILYKMKFQSKRWILYAGILATSEAYDCTSFLDGYRFLGLTGILPLSYIFVVGAAADIAVFMRTNSSWWKNRLSSGILARITTHEKERTWALAAIWVGLNVGLYYSPNTVLWYIAGYATVFGSYGVGKVSAARRNHGKGAEWVIYLAVVASSTGVDLGFTGGLLLSTLPFFTYISFRFYENDQAFIRGYFPDWMNFRKPRSPPLSSTQETV